jgi:hypothetical protein
VPLDETLAETESRGLREPLAVSELLDEMESKPLPVADTFAVSDGDREVGGTGELLPLRVTLGEGLTSADALTLTLELPVSL